jgi:tRNA threonylcarbamoyladenosine biosynthesis protein TsaE
VEKECTVDTFSEEETKVLARTIARHLKPGDVIALEGDLGAGKTTFAQGIAKALGISGPVDSPTFTIIKEYEGTLPLYHMDVYRIDSPEEELGLEEYFYGDGVCLVEWASRVEPLLPDSTLWMFLTVKPDRRRIRIRSKDPRWNSLMKELAAR